MSPWRCIELIYFIEGIFGAGKTTRSEALYSQLRDRGDDAVLYYEHEISNLLDFTRKACMSEEEFSEFISELTERLLRNHDKNDTEYLLRRVYENSVYINREWWVAWYKIGFTNAYANDLIKTLYTREICSGNVSIDVYLKKYMDIWDRCLGEIDPNKAHIFEGALLHNPVIDLVGYYMLPDDEIIAFYRSLWSVIDKLLVKIEYIFPEDAAGVLKNAAKERTSSSSMWIESLIRWSEDCPYGRKHKLKGLEGAISLCEEMLRVHCLVYKTLSMPVTLIERK